MAKPPEKPTRPRATEKAPREGDRDISERLRHYRVLSGLTQTELGRAMGVTFQQVQKYERGDNRVPAGRLSDAAAALRIPLSYLYGSHEDRLPGFSEAGAPPYRGGLPVIRDGQELMAAFGLLTSPAVRRRVVDLVKVLAAEQAEGAKDSGKKGGGGEDGSVR